MPITILADDTVVHGHFEFGIHEQCEFMNTGSGDFVYTTFIRHPVERFLNECYACAYHEGYKNHQYVNEFDNPLEKAFEIEDHRNIYVKRLTGKFGEKVDGSDFSLACDRLRELDFIGNFHNMQSELDRFADRYGLPRNKLPHYNAGGGKYTMEKISQKQLGLAYELNALDCTLYHQLLKGEIL